MPFSKVDEKSPVYDQLLKWLFSGNVAPGTRLVEQSLAREFGVSRIPIRESIHKMVAQGLLVEGGRGSSVRTRVYTPEEIQELSDLRESLEVGSARTAAVNATETDLTRMEMICNEFEVAIRGSNRERFDRLDHQFHAAVAEASHNKRLIQSLKHLLVEYHYMLFNCLIDTQSDKPASELSLADVAEEHRALVEAIRAGDADRADAIVRNHIRTSGRRAAREMIASGL